VVKICNKAIFYLRKHKRIKNFIFKRLWHPNTFLML
jgi:isoprenylcysteine carboxyl methyltransferase (ICMT) family protein YpbQ